MTSTTTHALLRGVEDLCLEVQDLCLEVPSLRALADERLSALLAELRDQAPQHAAQVAQRRAAVVLPASITFHDETVANMLRDDPALFAMVTEVVAELRAAIAPDVAIMMLASFEPEGCPICSPQEPHMVVTMRRGPADSYPEFPPAFDAWREANHDRIRVTGLLVMPEWQHEEEDAGGRGDATVSSRPLAHTIPDSEAGPIAQPRDLVEETKTLVQGRIDADDARDLRDAFR